MKLLRGLDKFPAELRGGALTIGNFDGVHRGHEQVVQALRRHAGRLGGVAVVFTFDPPPARILRPERCPPPLTWIDRKAELLSDLGVDVVVAYPTDRALLSLNYQAFFQEIVLDRIGARAMVEGPNFYFGQDRQGDIQELNRLCHAHALDLEIVQASTESGSEMISSSRIRAWIGQGDVRTAGMFLTKPYRIRGLVVHGANRGTAIGFPTANLDGIDTLIPAYGVYAGRVSLDKNWHWVAIHIGPSPTFGDQLPRVELHVLDFDGSLYGQVLEVDFIDRIREVRAFASVEKLTEQLRCDVESTRNLGRQHGFN